jgi:hypothetical protein
MTTFDFLSTLLHALLGLLWIHAWALHLFVLLALIFINSNNSIIAFLRWLSV